MKLYSKPKFFLYLKALDVLLLDELGQLAAELISILDIIFRRIRQSNAFMGGVLVISTMDPLQLPPIQGRPPLLSPYLITCFMLFELKHSVRASLDSNFRRIQDITRMLPTQLTQEILEEFKSLIIQNCTFVPNWNDPRIPDLAL